MALITTAEVVRGLSIGVFGGMAGACTLAFPGSALWVVPAGLAVGSCALTVPEIRDEVRKALPVLAQARPLLPTPRAVGHWVMTGEWRAPAAAPTRKAPRPTLAADPLFSALDEEPHRIVIGHTRGGKSTAMHAMTAQWRRQGHPVLVCDPDAAWGQWPGCEVAGFNEDYEGIQNALRGVGDMFRARSERYADGDRDFPPYHLVIDEAHEVFHQVPGALKTVDTIARRGAKRGIFLTVGTQDNHVDSLGLSSAAVLQNFITAELRRDAQGQRVATVYRGNAAKQRDARTYNVPSLPDPRTYIKRRAGETPSPVRAAVAAEGVRPRVVSERVPARRTDADLLAALMGEAPPAVSPHPKAAIPASGIGISHDTDTDTAAGITVDTGGGGSVTVNVRQVVGRAARRVASGLNMRGRHQRLARYGQIKALVGQGKGTNEIYRAVLGNRNEVVDDVRRAKAELGRP